ncbi:MAG TPA: hypothetical protein PKK26_16495, partial [Candidatus Wallbacteria bacterium]|nr:hypothetical protein [Candidatus Wallbacteria bacterium]
ETKFAVGIDLLGNVYSYQSGKTTGFNIDETSTYEMSGPVRYHPKYKNFRIKPGETVASSVTRGRNLDRWKRVYVHFYPPIRGAKGLQEDKRYVIYMYPKENASKGVEIYFDGLQLQKSKYATKYTPDKTLILGPLVDETNGVLLDIIKPLNEMVPYQMR